MKTSYLKPNFKRNPLNYVFVVLFFVLGFVSASAFAYVQTFSSGLYHENRTQAYNACVSHRGSSPCRTGSRGTGQVFSGYPVVEYFKYYDDTTNDGVFRYEWQYTCGSGKVYTSGEQCVIDTRPPPPPDCPIDDLQVLSYEYMSSSKVSNKFPTNFTKDGCNYTVLGVALTEGYDDFLSNTNLPEDGAYNSCATLVDGFDTSCLFTTIARGTGPSEPETPNTPDIDKTPEDLEEQGYKETTDNRVDESEKTVGETVTETLSDGSVSTQTTQETVTRGKGFTAVKKTDVLSVTRTDGIQKIVTTTTTKFTNDDGTTKTVVTENTTYTQKPVDVVTITKNPDGTYSYSAGKTPSSSSGTTKTTTTNKDADGNTTGESSTTSGECKEGAENCQDGKAGECDPTKEDCGDGKEWAPEEGDGLFDMEGMAAKIEEAKQSLSTAISDVRSEASELVEFDGSGTSSLGCLPSIVVPHFGTYTMCLSQYASALEPISFAFLFMATLIALMIILRD